MRGIELYVKKKKMSTDFCEYFYKETSESKIYSNKHSGPQFIISLEWTLLFHKKFFFFFFFGCTVQHAGS